MATLVSWALFGFLAAMVLVLLLPAVLGFRNFTVLSGSMEPALSTGDVILERRVSPLDVKVGDIVTFRNPADRSVLITHRVRKIEVRDGTARFVTKGDANNTVERWDIPADGSLGRVEARIPRAGYVLAWARTPLGRLLLLVIPAFLLGAHELIRIWRPRREREADDAAS